MKLYNEAGQMHVRGDAHMKDKRLTGSICVLIVLCVLAALVMLALAALLLMGGEEAQPGAAQTPTPTSGGLLQAADLEPDPTRLYLTFDLPLADGAGKTQELRDMRGKPALLLFWSSWCGDCKRYLESGFEEAAAAAEAAGSPLLLVCREGVRGDDYAQASEQLRALGISRDTLMDPQASLFASLGLHSVPSLAVLDAQGRLVLSTTAMPDSDGIARILDYARGGQLKQLDAFARTLIRQDGTMPSSAVVSEDGITPGRVVLSETQGLLMRYALESGDQALFDLVWHAARDTLLENGLLAWQTVDGEKGAVNASLDDLRVIDALYSAESAWGGYRADASQMAHALYNACVQQQLMRDFSQYADGQTTLQVTLCYQHPAAMRRIAPLDVRWNGAADRAEAILTGGLISDAFPLYYPRYDSATDTYTGDTLHMTEAMVTVLRAAEAGIVQERTLQWLEAMLRQGPLYASYDTQGRVVPGYAYESTAIYALAAQIGQICGREELQRLALARMERLRCFTGPLAGGYGRATDRSLYAYDVLQALLAWQGAAAHQPSGG